MFKEFKRSTLPLRTHNGVRRHRLYILKTIKIHSGEPFVLRKYRKTVPSVHDILVFSIYGFTT